MCPGKLSTFLARARKQEVLDRPITNIGSGQGGVTGRFRNTHFTQVEPDATLGVPSALGRCHQSRYRSVNAPLSCLLFVGAMYLEICGQTIQSLTTPIISWIAAVVKERNCLKRLELASPCKVRLISLDRLYSLPLHRLVFEQPK